MKSRDGKSQRTKEKKKEDQSRESQKKEDPGARKGRKAAKHRVFFQCFVAPGGRKEGSLKRQVLSLLATWEMKSYTLLWREALFGDKMYKRPQLRSTFRSWDVEKVDGIVGAKHISKPKCTKHTIPRPLLEVGRRKGLCTLPQVGKKGFCSSFKYNHHYTTLHPTTLQLRLRLRLQLQLHYTTLITLHYTALH